MELWDVYDADRNPTGRTMVRGGVRRPGELHLVIHVCIFDARGRMLIQQRQTFKEGWPNLWDITVGGSALAGENSRQAAEREVREELGLKIDLRGARPHLTVNFEAGFDDIYLIRQDLDERALVLQPEEVQRVRWATREEILQLLAENAFIPYHPSLIRLIFDMKDRMSGLMED